MSEQSSEFITPPVLPDADPLLGTTLDGKFELLAVVGVGGMGKVYRARHLAMDKEIAVKILNPRLLADSQALIRFQNEARLASLLEHPNVVTVFSSGVVQDVPYIAMEFLHGVTLADAIQNRRRVTVERILKIAVQCCEALEYAHGKNVIHRDLKPSNIILLGPCEAETVKLADFGIAKMLPGAEAPMQHLTQTGEIFGSPNYMSPEQCEGKEVDQRSDIYAMGCILYEAITGVTAFSGDSVYEVMFKHLQQEPALFEEVNPSCKGLTGLEKIVFKCLRRAPEERYASFAELRADLEEWGKTRTDSPAIAGGGTLKRQKHIYRASRLIVSVAVATALCGAVVLALTMTAQTNQFRNRMQLIAAEPDPTRRCSSAIDLGTESQTSNRTEQALEAYSLAVAQLEKTGALASLLPGLRRMSVYLEEHKRFEEAALASMFPYEQNALNRLVLENSDSHEKRQMIFDLVEFAPVAFQQQVEARRFDKAEAVGQSVLKIIDHLVRKLNSNADGLKIVDHLLSKLNSNPEGNLTAHYGELGRLEPDIKQLHLSMTKLARNADFDRSGRLLTASEASDLALKWATVCNRILSDSDTANYWYRAAVNDGKDLPSTKPAVKLLEELRRAGDEDSDLADQISFYEQAVDKQKTLPEEVAQHPVAAWRTIHSLGGLYERSGRNSQAYKTFKEASELAAGAALSKEKADSLIAMGRVGARAKQQEARVQATLAEAESLIQTTPNIKSDSVQLKLGQAYVFAKHPEQAEQHLLMSFQSPAAKHKIHAAVELINLYRITGRSEKIDEIYAQTIAFKNTEKIKKKKIRQGLIKLTGQYAEFLKSVGREKEAQSVLQTEREIADYSDKN